MKTRTIDKVKATVDPENPPDEMEEEAISATKKAEQASLWSDLRALPRSYWVLFSGTLINRFGHFVMPFLAVYLKREGYEAWVTGLALGAFGAGGLFAGALGGYGADKFGRKPTIVFSCVMGALAMITLGLSEGLIMIIVTTFFVGLAGSMYFPAASALLADLVPKPLLVRAFGCQRLAINLGFALGMTAAGFMASKSFLVLFIVDALTTTILALVVLFGLPKGRVRQEPIGAKGASWGPAVKEIMANKAYLRAIMASFLIAAVFWQINSSWGVFVIEAGGHSEKVFGLLMALNGIMIVLMELPLTSWTRKFSPVAVMRTGYVLVGLGMGLNLIGSGMPVLVTMMIVFTIGEMVALPVGHSYIASLAPEEMRGRFMGVLGMSWSAATMLGPAIGMALYELSPHAVWVVCLVCGLTAAKVVTPKKK